MYCFFIAILATILLPTQQVNAAVIGPLIPDHFPSPSIIYVNDTYYAFSSRHVTDKQIINTPIATSKSFDSGWEILNGVDALPNPGGWTEHPNAHVLTPDINQLEDGSFILYYAAHPKKSKDKKHCIGAATSHQVTGPFKPQKKALLCPNKGNGVGTADPNGFMYNATTQYLVFKNASGHDAQRQSYIVIEQVGKNGVSPKSKWTDLIDSTDADDHDVEGSALVRNPSSGGFVLFFTTGIFNTTNLRIEYATADDVLGPYSRRGVLLESGMYNGVNVSGPAGLDTVGSNVSEAVFESFVETADGKRQRQMFGVTLLYNDTDVSIA